MICKPLELLAVVLIGERAPSRPFPRGLQLDVADQQLVNGDADVGTDTRMAGGCLRAGHSCNGHQAPDRLDELDDRRLQLILGLCRDGVCGAEVARQTIREPVYRGAEGRLHGTILRDRADGMGPLLLATKATEGGRPRAGGLSPRQDARMRILLWHGYLLGGTGSNVYTRMLAREWSRAGHDVTVLSQEPHPDRYDLGGAATVRPDVGGLLPVFVLDRYDGYEVKRVQDCTRGELDGWVEANAAAIRALLPADLVFANHVLLGGAVGAATGAPFAVKAHGSELEYSMRGNAELSAWGAQALTQARVTFVGSEHIRSVLRDVCGHVENVVEVPPGVDVDEWVPEPRDEALAALLDEARRDPPNPGNAEERLPDEHNAERLRAFLEPAGPVVVYFGKLIEQKGVHVLLDALRGIDARVVVVGFGPERAALERQAAERGVRALFTGPLEHRHLRHLLALADACVVPSIFPEAFGMVAAEAAAAGCPPLVARHSGLAEVAAGLEAAYPPHLSHLAAFATGDADDLRLQAGELLALSASDRTAIRAAARAVVVERWSWAGVARRLLDAGL